MIPTLGYASGLGGTRLECEYGPRFIKNNLKTLPLNWTSIIDIDFRLPTSLEKITDLNTRLAEEAFKLTQNDEFFLMFGGDHSCGIGTWSGVAEAKRKEGDIGLIWIDAHMDAHTFETTETGNIHGMPLAALLGHGDPCLTQILSHYPKINPQKLALIGARSYESGEEKLLKDLGVTVYNINDIKKKGFKSVLEESITSVSQETVGYGMSFDLDVIDPKEVNAVGTPVEDGIPFSEILSGLNSVHQGLPPLAFELVEYNPCLDTHFTTLDAIEKIVRCIATPKKAYV